LAPCPVFLAELPLLQIKRGIVRQLVFCVRDLVMEESDRGKLGFDVGWRPPASFEVCDVCGDMLWGNVSDPFETVLCREKNKESLERLCIPLLRLVAPLPVVLEDLLKLDSRLT
jgi:hypothetical protein